MYYPDISYLFETFSVGLVILLVLLGLIGFGFFILLLVFLSRDAGRRNMNVAGWVILAFFTGFYGVVVYLLNRGPILAPMGES